MLIVLYLIDLFIDFDIFNLFDCLILCFFGADFLLILLFLILIKGMDLINLLVLILI